MVKYNHNKLKGDVMGKSVATTVELRKKNRRELLSMLLKNGKTTRNNLRNGSGFSYTTIGNLLGDLQDEDFIIQQGEAKSTGGRKAQVVKVNPHRAYFISIDISGKLFKWGLYDLESTNCYYGSHEYIFQISYKRNFEKLLSSIKSQCIEMNILESLVYIGIIIPGNYEGNEDRISDSYDESGMESFKLKSTVYNTFQLPIVVKNDAKTAAYSELKNIADAENKQLFYFLVLKESFGAAILINGSIYQGGFGYAGEIYALVQEGCNNGKNLGDLLHPASDLEYISDKLGQSVSEQKFFELYREQNPVALELFNKTVNAFVRCILTIICILNPSDFRIGGFYNYYGEDLINSIKDKVKELGEDWQYKNFNIGLSNFSQHTLIDSLSFQMTDLWVESLWN